VEKGEEQQGGGKERGVGRGGTIGVRGEGGGGKGGE